MNNPSISNHVEQAVRGKPLNGDDLALLRKFDAHLSSDHKFFPSERSPLLTCAADALVTAREKLSSMGKMAREIAYYPDRTTLERVPAKAGQQRIAVSGDHQDAVVVICE